MTRLPLRDADPLARSIHGVFSDRAAATPGRIALECGEARITYRELDASSDQIAQRLRRRGIVVGDAVGLYMQRSPAAIAAILGILKAGAAYVPFDPSYPRKLLRFIYEDSAPRVMLVQDPPPELADGKPFWDGVAISVGGDYGADTADSGFCTMPELQPDDLAYIMYTSGSTGRPKGVLVPHRAVLRLVLGNDFADLDAGEVLLQLAPLSFDASTFEIWGALLNGGKLAILPSPHPSLDEIQATIQRHGVTTMWLTAGVFHLMVEHRLAGLKPLRQLLAGGDVLSPSQVGKALRGLPGCRLINGYGPTENTTFSCCYTIPRDAALTGAIPIGIPIRHTEVYLLDEALQPVADGELGELYVGGAGLARGYLNRPELTAERFIAHPFDATPGARLYRTGDHVRRRADGNLEFLGRADRQIKINGKRVELDEIEACLRRCPLVADAAAVSFEAAAGQRRIAAFVTPAAGEPLPPERLRDYLRQELPDYMMPASITTLGALPLSPTGKIDRASLPLPSTVAAPPPAQRAAARNSLEAELLRIWRQVLATDAVGLDDNFFDLGGTSLQLMQVHACIQSALGSDLTVVDLFTYPRISALAARIGHRAPLPAALLSAKDRARRRNAVLAGSHPIHERNLP